MLEITEKEALLILPAVVDNEASQEEREAFFAFIEGNVNVHKQYRDALLMKRLLSEKLVRKPAPPHLKDSIQHALKNLDNSDKDEDINLSDLRMDQPLKKRLIKTSGEKKSSALLFRYLSAAAVLMIFTLVTIQLLSRVNPIQEDGSTLVLENVSLEHFIHGDGRHIDPHFSFASTAEAEEFLAEHHQLKVPVPTIDGAVFSGIVLADYAENFQTPLLMYYQQEINETIYLFAFDLDAIDRMNGLSRNSHAAEYCVENEDFYVTEIDSHHVVSWLWDNTWYTAVSNHNGYDLASLVEPLNYTPQ